MENLFSKSLAEVEKIVIDLGESKFRAKQIREWLYRGCPDFSLMKNLPKPLLEKLSESFQPFPIKDQSRLDSEDGQTTKFLFSTADDEKIECVLMRASYGNSVCVSSQIGCSMGCKFCASTLRGFKRNLSADEMFSQVLRCQWELRADRGTKPNGDKNQNDITHVVIMGVGEPLLNLENVSTFMTMLHDNLAIGYRRITLSTCGIVPAIKKLESFDQPINLAISLHAPDDELRKKIMPVANEFSIAETLAAGFDFAAKRGRQLMIEYILLGGFNDSPEQAGQLAALLKGKNCMANLIPWNAVAECDWKIPSGNAAHRFQDILIQNGIHARIRKERGADISSACGQLRIG